MGRNVTKSKLGVNGGKVSNLAKNESFGKSGTRRTDMPKTPTKMSDWEGITKR